MAKIFYSMAGEGGARGDGGIGPVQASVRRRGRHMPPMRRLQPLDPAAFLIDEHEELIASDGVVEVGDERPDLVRVAAIAPKENEAAGAGCGKEGPLGVVERQARTAGDEGFEVHEAG